jgi:hypothetical protein
MFTKRAKALVAAKARPAAAAAVTNGYRAAMIFRRGLLFVAMLTGFSVAHAGVLPEDRADALYHRYDGGGVTIDGPSILVRKQVGKSLSFVGNYYVDHVSSASIDYTEERTQWSLGMDYLRGDTTMRIGYTNSDESDYDADTYSFSVSQDMFGGMTTLTLSYALGETATDEGYLNNPYRSVRYFDPGSALGYSYEGELYPNTRTSNALGLRARYFLPYRAAIEGEYRYFTDTWDIDSHTASLTYIHPWRDFTFTGKIRYHDQTGAHFYSDLFPRSEATNFRGRDKELSPLTSYTFKLQAAYTFLDENQSWGFIKRGSVTASVDLLHVDYDDFSDLTALAPIGEEPNYELDADIYQIFFSFWY